MQVDVISLSPAEEQAAVAAGLPRTYIQIAATDEELSEPKNLIRADMRAITVGKMVRRNSKVIAQEVFGLMFAASLRAKRIGDWSTCGTYDPLPDYLALQELLKSKLGLARGSKHPVTLVRGAVAGGISDLRKRSA